MIVNDKKSILILFNGINNEYWNLNKEEKERVINLINRLDFNQLSKYSYYEIETEKLINLIIFLVKTEYNKKYNLKYCKKVFKDYNITDIDYDKFMISLANYYNLL